MKPLRRYYGILAILAFCTLGLLAQNPLSAFDKKTVSDFEKRAKKYAELRETLRHRLPKLSHDSTPEQIQAHKTAFQKSVQSARKNAKQGDLFTPSSARLIRTTIKAEFKGWERTELRKTVFEVDPKGIRLKINFAYPETKELVEMSPALLFSLPQLPKQLRYRFVGRSLLILDRDNALILDYIKNALP